MTTKEIKTAIDNGKSVFWKSEIYPVIKDRNGQYLIKCTANDHCIELTDQDGETLNCNPQAFYILEHTELIDND